MENLLIIIYWPDPQKGSIFSLRKKSFFVSLTLVVQQDTGSLFSWYKSLQIKLIIRPHTC